ncbi:sensor histidine kinase [Saccharothrix algeriensis]|uniref:Signal transduction histidine kinase n=2 Tax=Saccharothrix algeriensis TaxID=173560 RepID=A0ABS2S2S2_9PSEU|nr:ATP-binding protein [Saccharothrix algeriensis]MBM7810519.1 signal transduction histidine kinase [Saccharothrix algeriensis]
MGGSAANFTKSGDAVEKLTLQGRQYVAAIRVITLIPTGIIALLLVGETPKVAVLVCALLVVAGWSAVYVRLLLVGPRRWVTITDAAVLAGVGLTSPWSVPTAWFADGRSWVLPFTAFACVGYQYYASAALGGVAALVVVLGVVTGTTVAIPAGGEADSLVTAVWSAALAVLARVLWTLVKRGGTRADELAAEAEDARSARAVAAEVRAAQQEYNRRLHDTAASTLLMVGVGEVSRHSDLLVAQAKRDLEALRSWEETLPTCPDLVQLLRAAIELVDLTVVLDAPEQVVLPPRVARTLVDAAAEALSNVMWHAGVLTCHVDVRVEKTGVLVRVTDKGTGFDPPGETTAGRGLRDSIRERMSAIGGSALVHSAPGKGTTVGLRWSEA